MLGSGILGTFSLRCSTSLASLVWSTDFTSGLSSASGCNVTEISDLSFAFWEERRTLGKLGKGILVGILGIFKRFINSAP
jgi:hypothetical protein